MSKPKRKNRASNGHVGEQVGYSLRRLRELSGLTQIELAKRLKVGQASISKIEHRGDVQVSSLHKYLEALGGKLRVEAAFGLNSPNGVRLRHGSRIDEPDAKQLVFPIFGDELSGTTKDVVLSVHPNHSTKIFEGRKTVELRRRFPVAAPQGITAYIYSTSPVRAMLGSTQIKDVLKLPIGEIWKRYGRMAQVDRKEFDDYFLGLEEGFALKITNVRSFSRPINLDELRVRFGFEPPQSFLYAPPMFRAALRNEYADLSH